MVDMHQIKLALLVFAGISMLGLAAPLLAAGTAGASPACDPNNPTSPACDSVEVCGANSTGACNKFIDNYINPLVTLLTVVIGVGAAISIVVAGIQYASAGSDPGKVQKAKDRIWQTIIGLLAYILLFSFLNYLVPGGLF